VSVLAPSAGHVVGWSVVSVLMALLVTWRLAPGSWRPRGWRRAVVVTAVTAVGAYVAVSVGHDHGFNQSLDWDVIETKLRAEVDGTDAWVVSGVVAFVVLGLGHYGRRRSR
jgi:hypothetical protein